jgi:hypothetical protein
MMLSGSKLVRASLRKLPPKRSWGSTSRPRRPPSCLVGATRGRGVRSLSTTTAAATTTRHKSSVAYEEMVVVDEVVDEHGVLDNSPLPSSDPFLEAWRVNLGRRPADPTWLTGARPEHWWTGCHPRATPGKCLPRERDARAYGPPWRVGVRAGTHPTHQRTSHSSPPVLCA